MDLTREKTSLDALYAFVVNSVLLKAFYKVRVSQLLGILFISLES